MSQAATGRTGKAKASDHRVVQQWLDRAPLLATGALPVVAARAEAAAAAAVAGIAHQQLVGDVLEVGEGRGRVGARRERQADQRGLASYGRPVIEMARGVGAGLGDTVLGIEIGRAPCGERVWEYV